MTQSIRIPITAAEKSELWQRWKKGESLSEIGRAFKRHAATIFAIVRTHGGYYPYQRKRSPRHLSFKAVSCKCSAGRSCLREHLQETVLNNQDLLTIKQLVAETPAVRESQLRWWIFHQDKFNFGHVIVKIGRRVLLDRFEFNRWLDNLRLAQIPTASI